MKKSQLTTFIIQPLITALILLVIIFGYTKLAGSSITINDSNTPQRTFTVEGTGKTTVKPDTYYTDFTVHQTGSTQDEAKNSGNEIQQKAVDALKKLGFTDKDIKTTNFSINPNYEPVVGIMRPNTGPNGYAADITTHVTSTSQDKINKAIDALTPLGVNVNGVQSTVGDVSKYQNEARNQAIQQAKQKAEDMAKSAGFKLGKIASIKEGPDNQGVQPGPIMMEKAIAPSTPTQINPGTEDITAQVTLTYYIND